MHADLSGHLNTLTDEMCKMNTGVGRITHRQARMAGLAPSPSPSPEASLDDKDNEDDTDSSNDDEMMTSQCLALCHS